MTEAAPALLETRRQRWLRRDGGPPRRQREGAGWLRCRAARCQGAGKPPRCAWLRIGPSDGRLGSSSQVRTSPQCPRASERAPGSV